MIRRILATLTPDQRAIVGPHIKAVADANEALSAAQRGLSLALMACVPEAREPGAILDPASMTIYVDAPPPVTGSSTITRKGGEQDAEGR